jgi:acetolactate synthase small subunit
MNRKLNYYKVETQVQNQVGVLARMTILLRKFDVNIQAIDVKPLKDGTNFYNINFILESNKDEQAITIVMKKLQRLIPVIKLTYTKK